MSAVIERDELELALGRAPPAQPASALAPSAPSAPRRSNARRLNSGSSTLAEASCEAAGGDARAKPGAPPPPAASVRHWTAGSRLISANRTPCWVISTSAEETNAPGTSSELSHGGGVEPPPPWPPPWP